MHKCVAIEYSRNFLSKEEFYNYGFDAYGEQFHNMNATLHYSKKVNAVCLVSYNTPAAFIINYDGNHYIYYIKSSQTTERQITRFFSEFGLELPAVKRKAPGTWIYIG